MSGPSTLIVPVESQVRELDAKILLACAAAERGFPVLLGSRALVHHAAPRLPRGVYLAKSMRTLSDRMFGILRRLGHEIVAWDEEALVRLPDAEYTRRRLSARAMGMTSHLLAWGEDDARVFRDFPGYRGTPIHVTGNPRADMLRPELRAFWRGEAEALRARFGELVLVNTNFGHVNHFFPQLGEMSRALADRTLEEAARSTDFDTRRAAYKQRLYEGFRAMLPALAAAVPDGHVVVRPHPSERFASWEELASHLRNVTVDGRGSAIPWLLAARALVHNGCTTAVEATVLGTPAVVWQPVPLPAPELDDPLPNGLGWEAADLGALRKRVDEARAGVLRAGVDAERRALLARHLASLEGPLAADRIVGVLVEAGYLASPPPRPPARQRAEGWLHATGRTLVKRVNMRRPGHRNARSYQRHRWPALRVEDVQERIRRLHDALGRFEGVRARAWGDQIFAIRR